MIHGIEIKSTKSTGNKNSLSLTLSPLDCTHSYYKIAILQMRRHWRRKLRSSAYVFIRKHESRAGEETPIDDTWDSLSLSLFGFSAIVYYCDSLISRLVVWTIKKIYQQQTKKKKKKKSWCGKGREGRKREGEVMRGRIKLWMWNCITIDH